MPLCCKGFAKKTCIAIKRYGYCQELWKVTTALDWKLDIAALITAAPTWSQPKIVRLTKRLKNEALGSWRLIHHTEQYVFRVVTSTLWYFPNRKEEHGTTFPPLPFWLCFPIFRGFAFLLWIVVWMFYSPFPNLKTAEWTVKTKSPTMMTSTLATSTMMTSADRSMAEPVPIGLILTLVVFFRFW